MTDQAVLRAKIRAEAFDILTPEQQENARQLRENAEQRMDRLRQARKQRQTPA